MARDSAKKEPLYHPIAESDSHFFVLQQVNHPSKIPGIIYSF